MKLALQTDFALRTLMYLAWRNERCKGADVAQFFGISSAHISKVVNQLAKLGYVRSVRGAGGGIELAKPADQVTLGDVIVAFEGSMNLLDCIDVEEVCTIQSFCKLRNVLADAQQLQLDFLRSKTLADVLPTPRQLTKLDA